MVEPEHGALCRPKGATALRLQGFEGGAFSRLSQTLRARETFFKGSHFKCAPSDPCPRARDVPKPPSRHEAQGVEADCEARGKLKNDKARGRFAGHSIAPVEDEPRANSERCYGLPC